MTQDAPTNDSGTLPISGVQLSGLARPVPRLVLAWSTAEGPPPGDRLVFERAGDEVALGRSTTGWNGADLADPAMSRHQATVRREGHKLVLHNHGGTNPTAVQGATLSTPRVLEEGDVVRMGNTLMVARYGSPAEDLGLRGETLGHSDAVRAAWRQMELLARIDKTALILGESGTGKELAARDIAALGHRRPLTAFNLANLPASLVASELFGHERGAFSGADARREGLLSAPGTVLLDEIGDAPPEVQTSLLRVLEDMRIRPVGARTSIPVRARLLAATHRDLNQLVKDHSFRFDLRMRLMGASLVLPALRERREDIPLLAQHFATELDPRATLSATTLHEMTLADWPGNVRQLQKFVERLYVEAAGDERLSLSPHLAAELRSPIPLATPVSSPDRTPRQGVAAPLSAAELEDAMRRAGGVISRAAALLSVDVKTFKRRCKDHGLSAAELKERLRRT